ncbi:phage tail protein [Dickeya chrysanthemi]|uniref:phage tail-collar fiber domain-containing protein n=1 Tax=Dickeya chrysanthemi TaxID=556 RepID=UPI0003A54A53|nr:phage tail protein [Dickeya chrysanthemi]
MSTKYTALLTQVGADRLANAIALGKQLEIARMGVGDGGGVLPTPDATQTKLINEKRRAALNSLSIDPANANQIIAEQVIPENEGGFWLREIGLYDADDNLIAVANCPETYKPQMQEGSGRVQTVRMILAVSQTQAVSLNIDPAVVLATRKSVDDKAIEVKTYADELMAKHLVDANPHKQYAPLASPALTGTPTAPTAALGTSTTQLATTALVRTSQGGYAGYQFLSSSTTLTASHANKLLTLGNGVTATLPDPSTLPAGTVFELISAGGTAALGLTEGSTVVNTPIKPLTFPLSLLLNERIRFVSTGANTTWICENYITQNSVPFTGQITVTGDGQQILLQQSTKAPSSGSYIKGLNSDGVFLWTVGHNEANDWLELVGKGNSRIVLADSGDITIAPGAGKTTKITSTVTLTAPAAGDNSNSAITSGWFAAEIAGIPLPWPQAAVPTGWLKCNGQAFDKNLYPRLAQVYPSGVLPDLRGEFIRGWDDGRGVDSWTNYRE